MSDHDNPDRPPAAFAGPNIAQVVWRQKWLLMLGAAVGVGLGAARYSRTPPVYQSSVQILIDRKSPDVSLTPGATPNCAGCTTTTTSPRT